MCTFVLEVGVCSNVIVGFLGEMDDDFVELEWFFIEVCLDVVGVFGYFDEDGIVVVDFDGKLVGDEITVWVVWVLVLVEELMV